MFAGTKSIEAVVVKHVRACLDCTAVSFDSYTAGVVEHYLKSVPVPQRSFEVASGGDAFADNRANSKKLGRYFSPEHDLKLPAVLLPSLIEGLVEPHRSACRTEVVELIMPERVSVENLPDEMVIAQGMAKEAGEALSNFLGLLPGGLGDDSVHALERCKVELNQAMQATRNALAAVNAELEARTGRGSTVAPITTRGRR